MREVVMLFSWCGMPLYFHDVQEATSMYVPDSTLLWSMIWKERKHLAGIAHTHEDLPEPSSIDLETFAAIDAGLGQQLYWPIVTRDRIRWWRFDAKTNSYRRSGGLWLSGVELLRRRSKL